MSEGAGARGPAGSGARLTRLDLARIAAVRLIVSAAVLSFGFRSVSDDDFSRVVIAQQLAHAPRLDPSGTSWLPFPFWLNGAAMLVLGRGLLVAQAVALLLGAASSVLVALAAQRLLADRRAALVAGHLATLVGWSAWLGVATVPELFTASLTLFAAATLAVRAPGARLLGALALLAATLSRYEPWPVALGFALWNAADVARRRLAPPPLPGAAAPPDPTARAERPRPAPAAAALGAIASVVAVAGPALWIAWNRAAHGDAFHFVARVTAYRRALGDAARESTLARLAAYPGALVREMPEVVLPAAALLLLATAPRARRAVLGRVRACAAPLALAGAQVLALSLALVKDGAPTHHPERAVLFPALALVVLVASFAAPGVLRSAAPGLVARLPRSLLPAAALLLLARASVLPAVARRAGPASPTLWAHLVRQVTPREAFIDRRPEVEIGALAAASAPPGARVYIERVDDYGYFAILAGSGRPEAFVLAADPDPRSPRKPPVTLADGESAYGQYLHQQDIDLVIAPAAEQAAEEPRWGAPPLLRTARFALWKAP